MIHARADYSASDLASLTARVQAERLDNIEREASSMKMEDDPFALVFRAMSKLPARQQAHIINNMLTDPAGLCLFNSPSFHKWLSAHRDNVAAYFKETPMTNRRGPARLSDREYLQLQRNLGNTPEPALVRRVFMAEDRARRAARAVKFTIPDLWRNQ